MENLTSKYLNPLTDYGFKAIFGEESCKELLIDFLNELIKEQGRIIDLNYLPAEQLGRKEEDRKAIFDIYCRTDREEFFIVELQRVRQAHFKDRSIYYSTFPIQAQSKQGKWNFKLQAVYMISIMDFNLCEDKKGNFYHEVKLLDTKTYEVFFDKLTSIYLELPKFNLSEDSLETNFERWIYLLKNLPSFENRPLELQGKVFDKLFTAAEIARLTPTEMENYKKSILEYDDIQDALAYAKELAREAGREEGREEGKTANNLDVAKKCLSEGLSVEIIIKLTGLTLEQINALKD